MNDNAYPYLRGDGVPVASPLFQEEGGGSIPTSPLQLRFKRIGDMQIAAQLNALWHSRMPYINPFQIILSGRHTAYVAEYDEAWFAIAIWTRPIAANRMTDGMLCLELRRLAISPQAPKNTATRMLAYMARQLRILYPDVIRLVSYQDTGVHTGTIYAAAGWKAVKQCEFISWHEHGDAPCKVEQSQSAKIRWEKAL